MPKSCCVVGCTVNSIKNAELKFHMIPLSGSRREKWLRAINRSEVKDNGSLKLWEPTSNSTYVCGRHFISGEMSRDSTDPDFVPSIFPNPKRIKKPNVNPDFVSSIFPNPKRIKKPNVNPDFVPSVSLFPKDKKNKQSNVETDGVPNKKTEMTSHNPDAASSNTTLLVGKDIVIEWPDLVDLTVQHCQLQTAYTDLQAEVDRLSAKNERLKEDLHRVLPRFSYASVKGDDEQLLFLTGLHGVVFDWLVSQVAAKIEGVLPELTTCDHLLMVLMKLKLGVCDRDLAYRFGIPESSVTSLCQTWLPALTAALKPLVAWPSAEIVAKSRPGILKGKFRRCRCIIDCPEFVVARVGANKDKQECTRKYFASVTPAGAVSFLSSGHSGTTPERRIIKESGFLHLVDPRDEILANSQIPIRDELASLGAVLHVPDPNDDKQTQKSDADKQLSHIWTHVKKAIGWWKEFRMLQKIIQEPYADLLDDVLIVCAVLTNVNMSLAPKGNNQS